MITGNIRKKYIGQQSQNKVKGDNKVFDISNANVIFAGDSEQAAMVAVGYNHFYCLPNKQLKYFVMNFKAIFQSIQESNGASYNLHTGELNPSTGYMVAIPGFEQKYDVPIDHNKFQDIVISYLTNRDIWNKIAENLDKIFVGFWIHDDQLYIDLSENIPDIETAFHEGIFRNQIAIYDCKNKCDFKIPVIPYYSKKSPLKTYSFTEEDINFITFALRRLNENTVMEGIVKHTRNLIQYIERLKKENESV